MNRPITFLFGVCAAAAAVGCATAAHSPPSEVAPVVSAPASRGETGGALTVGAGGPTAIEHVPCKPDETERRRPAVAVGIQQAIATDGETRPFVRYDCNGK